MRRTARYVLVGVALLIVAGAALSVVLHKQFDNDPNVQRFRSMKGKTETEVRGALGEPQRVYEKATAPADYYEKGYTHEQRPITNKVFIYFGEPDLIAYIYFDTSNRVEHVFVGAS